MSSTLNALLILPRAAPSGSGRASSASRPRRRPHPPSPVGGLPRRSGRGGGGTLGRLQRFPCRHDGHGEILRREETRRCSGLQLRCALPALSPLLRVSKDPIRNEAQQTVLHPNDSSTDSPALGALRCAPSLTLSFYLCLLCPSHVLSRLTQRRSHREGDEDEHP